MIQMPSIDNLNIAEYDSNTGRHMSNKGIEINGNVGNLHVQQDCVNSTMNVTIINDSQFFIKAQEIIDSIKQYDTDFKSTFHEKEQEIRSELTIAQDCVNKKDRSRLSKALTTIKDIAKSITSNVIASSIVHLIAGGGI